MQINKPKIAILWGGGLGDLLVISPFLRAANQAGRECYLMTTANHLPMLASELKLDVHLVQLTKKYHDLWRIIGKYRKTFDLIYLGPYPSLQTRLLALLLSPGQIWSHRHRSADCFIAEQIRADIDEIFPVTEPGPDRDNACRPWPGTDLSKVLQHKPSNPYLVLHLGAKGLWRTKSWPRECWLELMARLLTTENLDLQLVGVKSESSEIEAMIKALPGELQARVTASISRPLTEIAALINESKGLICHNSGIMNIAVILQKKTVCITGSSAKYWRPPYPWLKNISSGLCNLACNRYRCPVPFFRHKCIRKLQVADVWTTVEQHLLK